MVVRVDSARSAEPVIKLGSTLAIAFITFPEAVRVGNDQRRTLRFAFRIIDRLQECFAIVAFDFLNEPVIGFETVSNRFGKCEACFAIDGDVIIAIYVNQFVEPMMTRERSSFMR